MYKDRKCTACGKIIHRHDVAHHGLLNDGPYCTGCFIEYLAVQLDGRKTTEEIGLIVRDIEREALRLAVPAMQNGNTAGQGQPLAAVN